MNFVEEVSDSCLDITIFCTKLDQDLVVVDEGWHLLTAIEKELDTADFLFNRRNFVAPTDVLAWVHSSEGGGIEKINQAIAQRRCVIVPVVVHLVGELRRPASC